LILVLDTNVFVAACFGGHAARIVQDWLAGRYGLVVSGAVLDEYEAVLVRHPMARRHEGAMALWREGWNDARLTQRVQPTQVGPWCNDSSDDKFIAAGLEGGAQALLTSDHMLLTLVRIGDLSIQSPKRFAEAEASAKV
jgi:predicted nucleic acid-binding protein